MRIDGLRSYAFLLASVDANSVELVGFRPMLELSSQGNYAMFLSHFNAGTGCVVVETREEARMLLDLRRELPNAEIAKIIAPTGDLIGVTYDQSRNKIAFNKEPIAKGISLTAAYAWAAAAEGRVLVVYDWHPIANNPGHWRALSNAIPGVRCPLSGEAPSMIVFVVPSLTLDTSNPLTGNLTFLRYASPKREAMRQVAESLQSLPLGQEGERVLDALCGLTAEVAEQVCAENLISNGGRWNPKALNEARRHALRSGGLEIWEPVQHLGGLGNLKSHIENEVIPWIRDDVLAIRRILAAGLPGTGKSYFARWLADKLGCECARLSIPRLKGGVVGQSEKNLRRALGTIDDMAADSPLLVVLDEIDTIARTGNDGGASSGTFAELLVWLQDSKSMAIVVGTLNRLDNLDSAISSRFASKFFFDLPSADERRAVSTLHYQRCGCPLDTVNLLADITDGFSNRELAEGVIPSIARLSNRQPTPAIVNKICGDFQPESKLQVEQIEKMRAAAQTLLKANDPVGFQEPSGRKMNIPS